tara:strand:+ start:1497 stop:1952 length:456 start_codon:yes stop_codon:yes gene_type:complete
MSKLLVIVLIGAVLVLPLPAWPHTDVYFDSVNAPHGGQLRMAGPYHLELVAKDNEIMLYVTDHADVKINTDDGISKASVQTGKAKASVKLEPAGDNMFKGSGEFLVKPDTLIIVFIKLPEQEAHAARFTPLKPGQKLKTRDGHAEHHPMEH